jgi:hypothetical protein
MAPYSLVTTVFSMCYSEIFGWPIKIRTDLSEKTTAMDDCVLFLFSSYWIALHPTKLPLLSEIIPNPGRAGTQGIFVAAR